MVSSLVKESVHGAFPANIASTIGGASGAKTPVQTLYGAIVRENKTKEQPRIVKSDIKGKFIYAGE